MEFYDCPYLGNFIAIFQRGRLKPPTRWPFEKSIIYRRHSQSKLHKKGDFQRHHWGPWPHLGPHLGPSTGGNRCAIADTYWQTETGSHLITPLVGAMVCKPGAKPFWSFFNWTLFNMFNIGGETQGGR